MLPSLNAFPVVEIELNPDILGAGLAPVVMIPPKDIIKYSARTLPEYMGR